MSDLQKEVCASSAMGRVYVAISKVFDQMPVRFKLLDLISAAGLKDGPQVRGAVGSVLFRDFRCVSVGSGMNRCWKKL